MGGLCPIVSHRTDAGSWRAIVGLETEASSREAANRWSGGIVYGLTRGSLVHAAAGDALSLLADLD